MTVQADRVAVGRVVKAHGIRGEVAVEPYTDAPDRFAPGARVMADEAELTVEASRPHQGRLLVKFEQVRDRTAAEAMRGTVLTIDEDEVRALDEMTFYPHELDGFEVRDEAGTSLGHFTGVLESPANDLWVVRAGAKDVLVPAVRDIVREVDRAARRIVLRPPDGLF